MEKVTYKLGAPPKNCHHFAIPFMCPLNHFSMAIKTLTLSKVFKLSETKNEYVNELFVTIGRLSKFGIWF